MSPNCRSRVFHSSKMPKILSLSGFCTQETFTVCSIEWPNRNCSSTRLYALLLAGGCCKFATHDLLPAQILKSL
jgi:hypothetical protein